MLYALLQNASPWSNVDLCRSSRSRIYLVCKLINLMVRRRQRNKDRVSSSLLLLLNLLSSALLNELPGLLKGWVELKSRMAGWEWSPSAELSLISTFNRRNPVSRLFLDHLGKRWCLSVSRSGKPSHQVDEWKLSRRNLLSSTYKDINIDAKPTHKFGDSQAGDKFRRETDTQILGKSGRG